MNDMTPQEKVFKIQDELIAEMQKQIDNLTEQVELLKRMDDNNNKLVENLTAQNEILKSQNNLLMSVGGIN